MERPAGKFVYIVATEKGKTDIDDADGETRSRCCLTLFGRKEISDRGEGIVDCHSQGIPSPRCSCPRCELRSQVESVRLG